jgi:hypothetical protein
MRLQKLHISVSIFEVSYDYHTTEERLQRQNALDDLFRAFGGLGCPLAGGKVTGCAWRYGRHMGSLGQPDHSVLNDVVKEVNGWDHSSSTSVEMKSLTLTS